LAQAPGTTDSLAPFECAPVLCEHVFDSTTVEVGLGVVNRVC
jgi:hypothetical protein